MRSCNVVLVHEPTDRLSQALGMAVLVRRVGRQLYCSLFSDHSSALCLVVQILPASLVRPSPSRTWQSLFAGSLLLLTLGSCVQLGLAANVHLLPKVGGRGFRVRPPPTLHRQCARGCQICEC